MSIILLGLSVIIFITSTLCAHFNGVNSKIEYARQEKLGSLFYENQKKEGRLTDYGNKLTNLNPNFPCVRGVVPIGLNTNESIDDGHKFGCGISHISSSPIVYSFGSRNQIDFEVAFLKLRKDSKIFSFEIDGNFVPKIPPDYNQSIFAHHIGLSYHSKDDHLMTLTDIMKKFNHKYIDVLKMDIESTEWQFIQREAVLLRNVGQFLVELHVPQSAQHSLQFLEAIETQGMGLFFKELNYHNHLDYTELSFIQSDWGNWDENKKNLQLPDV